MLYSRNSNDLPDNFPKIWKKLPELEGAISFRYISFELKNFLKNDDFLLLQDWCSKFQYNIRSYFYLCNNKETWQVNFNFTTSQRLLIENKSFQNLIKEVEKFILIIKTISQ